MINVTSLGICEENIVFGISFGWKMFTSSHSLVNIFNLHSPSYMGFRLAISTLWLLHDVH
jgi:hypothetical protein